MTMTVKFGSVNLIYFVERHFGCSLSQAVNNLLNMYVYHRIHANIFKSKNSSLVLHDPFAVLFWWYCLSWFFRRLNRLFFLSQVLCVVAVLTKARLKLAAAGEAMHCRQSDTKRVIQFPFRPARSKLTNLTGSRALPTYYFLYLSIFSYCTRPSLTESVVQSHLLWKRVKRGIE